MICFKDKSFCSYSKKCTTECDYKLTDILWLEALAWWNKDKKGEIEEPLICYHDWEGTNECNGYHEGDIDVLDI